MEKKYTPEHKQWLKNNMGKASSFVIAEKFNAVFGTTLTANRIRTLASKWQISPGKYTAPYSLYSEKTMSDGYVYVKIKTKGSRKNRYWKVKHRWLWEQTNGKIPKGMIIIFLDGNKNNIVLENLAMITKAEKVKLAQYGLISNNRELTLAGIAVVRHQLAIHSRLKKEIGKKAHHRFVNRESTKRCRQRNKIENNRVKEEIYPTKQECFDFLQNLSELKMKDIRILFNAHFETDFNERKLYRIFSKNNIPKRRKNSSGFKGVMKKGVKYEARIKFNNQFIYLGRYDTAAEAAAVRTRKEQELYSSAKKKVTKRGKSNHEG